MAYPKRNWPDILQDITESGLTLKEYSIRSNIPYSTICSHHRKTKQQTLVPEIQEGTGTFSFVKITDATVVKENQNSSGIHIRIGNAVIEVDESFNTKSLAMVLEVMHAGA